MMPMPEALGMKSHHHNTIRHQYLHHLDNLIVPEKKYQMDVNFLGSYRRHELMEEDEDDDDPWWSRIGTDALNHLYFSSCRHIDAAREIRRLVVVVNVYVAPSRLPRSELFESKSSHGHQCRCYPKIRRSILQSDVVPWQIRLQQSLPN